MSAERLREAARQARAEASIARDMVPYMVEQYDDDNGCALEARRHDAVADWLDYAACCYESAAAWNAERAADEMKAWARDPAELPDLAAALAVADAYLASAS